ncbi:hypothetical protein EVAR_39308_1 [Eumeta japonica]|uniref:Uncharacterized protein n=1 Tax=Eumeta variegata TaxID=151549 RepID=A0A4C1VXB7_EUMVA|nr:hypothetical protein EVAR_39308_1 [Eumeta japonica]
MMSVYSLTTPLDLWLAREFFKFGPLKWGHHHWTVGVVSLMRRRPGMRQPISPPSRIYTRKKGCGRSATERQRIMNAKVHCHASPIKTCMQLICAGVSTIYKCSKIIASGTVALQPSHMKLKYRSFDRLKNLSITCPPHRKKFILRSL